MKLKLKHKIVILTGASLLIPTIIITLISIINIRNSATVQINEFKDDELKKLKKYLKHVTDVAYGTIEERHKYALTLTDSGNSTSPEAEMDKCLNELAKIRFDEGDGYFWVTDNQTPFPTMLMHAEKMNLKGKVLSDSAYQVEKYEKRNIYQVRVEKCNTSGEAFVEYTMKKPGSKEIFNKISYSRLYQPLGWVISTGYYTDQIDKEVAIRKSVLENQIRTITLMISVVAILLMAVGIWIAFFFSSQITEALKVVGGKVADLALGKQVDAVKSDRNDEIGEMEGSFNGLVEGLRTYTAFAREIGNGNLTSDFKPLSEEDVLGSELIAMRDNLKKAEQDKAMREWTNEGLAQLGEVLRKYNNNTRELADQILLALIKYVKMNQGTFFLYVNDTEKGEEYLERIASYAFNKKKFIKQRLNIGEGMAGQCYLEKQTTYLLEIPEDYVTITSGLGDAPPSVLIMVPLINNEKVYGVLEMASFRKLAEHEIAFIERIAESIASTVASVQVNENTKKLLDQSREMSEQMKAQEEELRQNQEELQATQEQMRRRQVELEEENERMKLELAKKNQ